MSNNLGSNETEQSIETPTSIVDVDLYQLYMYSGGNPFFDKYEDSNGNALVKKKEICNKKPQ